MLRASIAICVLLAACGGDPVAVELNFPSDETFLRSEFTRVQVFDLGASELGACPTLVGQTIGGTTEDPPSLDSGNVDVCDAFGGIAFDEVGEGPKAFVATTSASNQVILAGCTVAEIYPDAPAVVVHLSLTPSYDMIGEPSCASVADKCERGCP